MYIYNEQTDSSEEQDCPNAEMEGELEQIQQMYNLLKNQTALQVLAPDTYNNLIRTNLEEAIDH